jgi:hypothetical protein
MFSPMIPHIRKGSFVIMDLDDTFFKKDAFFKKDDPCKFTDLPGFIALYKHIQGNLVFLTAHVIKKEIHDKFTCLGLNHRDFTIIYTRIPKGPFLKLYKYPKDTVFIDNSKRQINSVRKHCPDIQCFHFQ